MNDLTIVVAVVMLVAIGLSMPLIELWLVRKGWIKMSTIMVIQAHRKYLMSGKAEDKRRWLELREERE